MGIKQLLVHNPFEWKDPMSYLAAAIRWRTGKFFNHTGLLVQINGKTYLIHAIFPVVQIIEFEKWKAKKSNRTIKIEDLEYNPEICTVDTALEYVGKWYKVIGLIQVFIWITFGIWIGSKSNRAVYCYHLVRDWLGDKEAYRAIPRLKTQQ